MEKIEINENFSLAFRFVTETNENIFLTGKAGTGKTTFLKYLKEHCSKNIIVAAPTGVAAINAGGVTLHSLFQLPFHPFLPTPAGKNDLLQKLRFTARRMDMIRKMDILVIDEISMVRCDTLDAIDTILRYIRREPNLSFGGVQILFIGDLYQLPPVAPRQDWMLLQEYYNSEFFFDSQVIRDDIPVLIELKKIFRQKNDSFISILNKVRNNEMSKEDFDELDLRLHPGFIAPFGENYITLTSHNFQADQINNAELQRLKATKFTYKAEVEGDFPSTMFPADELLELKSGAQVMFLKNDLEKRYFNGKIGVVKSLDNEEIVVNCDGTNITVEPEAWDNTQYTLDRHNGKLEQKVLGTFRQFPLRLAWAVTIHKSQGLTFDKVMIDAGRAFSSGQVYVALSRCKSLEGIVLLSKIPATAIRCNDAVVKNQQSMTPRGSLSERFEGARQVYTSQLLDEIFLFSDVEQKLNTLQTRIKDHSERLNREAGAWIFDLRSKFLQIQEIGKKFLRQVGTYMKDEPTIEKNEILQQRIILASKHFSPLFIEIKDTIFHHPLITELREVSRDTDEYLNQAFLSVLYQIYLLEYCRQPFSVTGFLQHKLKYSLPKASLNSYAGKRDQNYAGIPNPELYETLKRWRDETCQSYNLPIYMVANKKSLTEICTLLPATKKNLMLITGFGNAKVEKFGDDILDIVLDYCDKNGLQSNMGSISLSSKTKKNDTNTINQVSPSKTSTQMISFNLYKEGKTIEEIAKERKMVTTTIEGHLSTFIAEGLLDINKIVPVEIQTQIKEVAAIHGWTSYKTLKESLPESITYGQLRMTRASVKEKE